MYQIMLGTHHLHEKEIVHRDLKPENILIFKKRDETLNFKICDLSASKLQHIQ